MKTPTDRVLSEILSERDRQIAKGFDFAHDDMHEDGSLARFAETLIRGSGVTDCEDWTNRAAGHVVRKYSTDPRRLLVIAVATLVAEIERIDRLPPGTHLFRHPLEKCQCCEQMKRDVHEVRMNDGTTGSGNYWEICGDCRKKEANATA